MNKALTFTFIVVLITAYLCYDKPESWPTIPAFERAIYPHITTCQRCERPWKFVKSHSTYYDRDVGCFPLCERCWVKLSNPQARLPFYRKMVDWWIEMTPSDSLRYEQKWEKIKIAVLDGK